MNAPVRTNVKDGQPYRDIPVIAYPSHELLKPVPFTVAGLFGRVRHWRDERGMVHSELKDVPKLLLGFERERLRWMTPGPDGLVPKYPERG